MMSTMPQSDLEAADLAQEHAELAADPAGEEAELAAIHHARGLSWETARQVAHELSARDALAAHARDELGITDTGAAQPIQAAVASAASFAVGGAVPVALAILAPHAIVLPMVTIGVLITLAILGAVSAAAGGANKMRGAFRVFVWGALAMAATALIGHLAGTTVG